MVIPNAPREQSGLTPGGACRDRIPRRTYRDRAAPPQGILNPGAGFSGPPRGRKWNNNEPHTGGILGGSADPPPRARPRPLLPGAHPEQLQVPTDWSDDGRFIVYQSRQEGDLWVADLAGAGSLTPLLDSAALESSGAFSPGGRWLAFVSTETGHPEAYLQAFQAGRPPKLRGQRFRISWNGAVSVRWRGDGRELFYAGADGKMYTVPVRLTAQPEIGSPKALFDIEMEATTPVITPFTFDVSADGQRFLLPRLTTRERDHLVVVENWPQLLP